MSGPVGNSFVFPRVLMFWNNRTRGKTKLTVLARDLTLSVLLYISRLSLQQQQKNTRSE